MIASINVITLVRVKDSFLILNKIRKLEKLDFPKYKDITVIIIIRPYFRNGVEIFEVKERNVMYGNEILNRATGSFKNGIIIGYYIFDFKDIKEKYKDEFGNIVVKGYRNNPFKIVISSSRSNAYFYDVLNIH